MQERRLALRGDPVGSLRDAHPIRSLRDSHPLQALRDTHPLRALQDTHPLQSLLAADPLRSLRANRPMRPLRGAHPIVWIAVGVALGAIVEALFDPRQGAGRRARLRDEARGRARRVAHDVRGAALDIGARTRGALHELRARRNERGDVADDILAERVRAQIGRPVSTPGALEIDVHDGLVEVRGTILSREAEPLLRTVRRVRGVRDVVDRLERHEASGHTPSRQGSGNGEVG